MAPSCISYFKRGVKLSTTFNVLHSGKAGSLLVSNCMGMPPKRLLSAVFIGTRTRGSKIERGVGIQHIEVIRGSDHKGYIFCPITSKTPEEYLRAFEIAEHMEVVNPDILAMCIYAGTKGASATDDCCEVVKKHQPRQLQKVFAKRTLVFEKPCDEATLKAIITCFHTQGVSIDDPFAKTLEKKESVPRGAFSHVMGIGIGMKSLSLSI